MITVQKCRAVHDKSTTEPRGKHVTARCCKAASAWCTAQALLGRHIARSKQVRAAQKHRIAHSAGAAQKHHIVRSKQVRAAAHGAARQAHGTASARRVTRQVHSVELAFFRD